MPIDAPKYKFARLLFSFYNIHCSVFFNMSDGIFLNYGWNEKCLASSAQAARENRQYDVYVGVDVFGRGVFGGGGWNSNKVLKCSIQCLVWLCPLDFIHSLRYIMIKSLNSGTVKCVRRGGGTCYSLFPLIIY